MYVSVTCILVRSDDVRCVLTEGHDQKNAKPLINANAFLLGRFLNEALHGKKKEEC